MYPRQYLLIKMKWMYLNFILIICNSLLFHSWRGRGVWRNVRVEFLPQRHYNALQNGHLLPFKSPCVWMRGECVYKKNADMWSPFWSFWKSVLIFHHLDFYGTDSIRKKIQRTTTLFFSCWQRKGQLIKQLPSLTTFMGLWWTYW